MIASKLLAVCPSIVTILLRICPVFPFISLQQTWLGIRDDTAAHSGRHYYNLEYRS